MFLVLRLCQRRLAAVALHGAWRGAPIPSPYRNRTRQLVLQDMIRPFMARELQHV